MLTIEDTLKLIDAGYTAEQIRAMQPREPQPQEQQTQEQQTQEQQTQEPQPLTAADLAPVVEAIEALRKDFKSANLAAAQQPQNRQGVDEVLASIIAPGIGH